MADIYVATTGNDTTGTGTVSVPFATPGRAAAAMAVGDTMYVKSGSYTTTSDTTNVASGVVVLPAGTNGNICTVMQGYGTTIGDRVKPTLVAGAGVTFTKALVGGGNYNIVRDLDFDGNSSTTAIASSNANVALIERCVARNFANTSAGALASYRLFLDCVAESCSKGLLTGRSSTFRRCVVLSCGTSLDTSNSTNISIIESCIFYNSGVAALEGSNGSVAHYINSTFAHSTSSSIRVAAATGTNSQVIVENCIFWNAATAIDVPTGSRNSIKVRNCAFGNNTTDHTGLTTTGVEPNIENKIVLTANPFVNVPNNSTAKTSLDFALNNNASAGALCRAAALNVFPSLPAVVGFLDVGAVQSKSAGNSIFSGGVFG